MPLTHRQQILLNLHFIHRAMSEAQLDIHRATCAFGELDVSATIGHIMPFTERIQTAADQASCVVNSIKAHMPDPAAERLPRIDTVLRMLELAFDALNGTAKYKVPHRNTDSKTIASQLSELIQQIGDQPDA